MCHSGPHILPSSALQAIDALSFADQLILHSIGSVDGKSMQPAFNPEGAKSRDRSVLKCVNQMLLLTVQAEGLSRGEMSPPEVFGAMGIVI